MNRSGAEGDVSSAKVEALEQLRDAGFRVVAVVDNEPEMLRAMSEADATGEILFLHADTIFASRRQPTPSIVSGSTFGLAGLVDEAEVGRRVTLVWHGVNDEHNLQQFLSSEIGWAEVDVRSDPIGRLVLRHDSFVETPWARDEPVLPSARLPRGAPTEWTVGEARPEGWRCGRGRGAGSRLRVRLLR